ncbi:retrovirus-related pol polyprotein from transposon TNT 1-94 [Tanacetum coccineum]|uniref:Retrovirus-related pol polyprotein from transposon TNT 1-94 n=1 Tax=Tanacetum coccineum TaxID=301880 RepID=A0ABQ4XSF6_9ASTR
MTSSATDAPAIPVFSGTHYHIWAVKMKTYLKSQGLWKVVKTDESTLALGENPTVAQLRTYDTVSLKKDNVLICLHSSIADQIFTSIMDLETSKAIMKDEELVKDYSARMMDVVNQMRLHGEVMKDQKVVEKMMISVPPKFEAKISAIEESCDLDTLTVSGLTSKLQAQEQRISIRSEEKVEVLFEYLLKVTRLEIQNKTLSEEEILAKGTTKVLPYKTLLHHQIKFRHLEKYGRVKKARNNTQGVQQANVFGEDQVDDEHLFKASHLDKHPDSLTWLMDSRCTSYMIPKRFFFISLDTKDNLRVKLGDGSYTRAKGRGTIAINTKKGTKYISRVLYVPELDQSMLSVPQMIKNGYRVNFKNESRCVITNSYDVKITTLDMENDSYYLKLDVVDASAFSVTKDDSMKWHKIFGHFNYRTLQHMYSTKLVRDMPPISEVDSKWEGCELGKSRSGNKYFVLFINDYTRMCWVYFLSSKSSVFSIFKSFKKLVEVQSGSTLRILRTDNGGEYTSNEFEDFLWQEGISETLLPLVALHDTIKLIKPRSAQREILENHHLDVKSTLLLTQDEFNMGHSSPYLTWHGKQETTSTCFIFLKGKYASELLKKFQSSLCKPDLTFTTSILQVYPRFYGEPHSHIWELQKRDLMTAERTKHINVKYHAIREAKKNEEVKLKYYTSETQLSLDIAVTNVDYRKEA